MIIWLVSYNYIIFSQQLAMGFEIENYPNVVTAALVCNPQSIGLFQSALTLALDNNCDALISPIFPDVYLQNCEQQLNLDHCFILSDEHFKKYQINIIFPLINHCVWNLPLERRRSIINLIIGYSNYLNLRNIVLKLSQQNYSTIIETFEDPEVAKQLKRSVPNLIIIVQTSGDTDQQAKEDDCIWKNYINFQQKLDSMKFPLFLQLALQIKPNAPKNRIINRWKSQRIAFIILSTDCFTQNAKGFAILPAKHQRIVIELLVLKSTFAYKIEKSHSEEESHKDTQQYFKYIIYVFRKFAQNKLRSQKQAINLLDYLQNPLQPYADNLQSSTYEVFENDQQKYDEYQGAIQSALETFPKNKKIVIYYIGSGRGCLLYNAFSAARKTQRKIFVYAIEKNPYPIQTLKKRIKQNKWQNDVKIIFSDIRDYEMPQSPDIFLSQLLGGFGDNELSPECLYWAEKNVLTQTICIPMDYTSYIRPVSYQSVHRKIQKNMRQYYYTTNFGNFYTNFQCQQVWKFVHPLKNKKKQQGSNKKLDESNNYQCLFDRYSKNVFKSRDDIIINGFAGYFTSHLYDYAQLSILPDKPTFGMYSWFPLFFSFEQAEYLKKDEQIVIELWRKGTQKKVWYEWMYTIGQKQSDVHNKDGSVIAIQL